MKFILEKCISSDAGRYLSIPEEAYGSEVDATYQNSKNNSILISGSEMIRIGCKEGDFNVAGFKKNFLYVWGCFSMSEGN